MSAAPAPASAPVDAPAFGDNGIWMHEMISDCLSQQYKVRNVSFMGKSKFQQVSVVESFAFGKTLVLDGQTQSALMDEFVYHESLVHLPLMMHPNPKTVFIGGGGELATAREVLKHKSVERVVMCDIDELVVQICAKELPEWGRGCLDDPRLEVHYRDAYAFLEQSKEKFDVVIMDIADPLEAGPGIALYYKEFYDMVRDNRLTDKGILVTQSGAAGIDSCTECFTSIFNTLCQSFKLVVPYSSDVASFGTVWGFSVAVSSDDEEYLKSVDPRLWSRDAIDKLIEERIDTSTKYGDLRFLDNASLMNMVNVIKPVREKLLSEERIISSENPVFVWAG